MGLAASQARLIMLTGRQNDLEFSGMQLSQKRMQITNQVQELMAQEQQGDTAQGSQMPDFGQLFQSAGSILGIIDPEVGKIGSSLGGMFGNIIGSILGGGQSQSASSSKKDIDSKLKQLEEEDKGLQIKLEQIDTQHKAVQTEVDSVQKVIDKNIEMSFKILG